MFAIIKRASQNNQNFGIFNIVLKKSTIALIGLWPSAFNQIKEKEQCTKKIFVSCACPACPEPVEGSPSMGA
jgi:hypothetical protein